MFSALMLISFSCPAAQAEELSPTVNMTRVERLVESLRSPLHAERHRATLELKALDRDELAQLQSAYAAHPDLEIRARLQEAAEGILFREALSGMGGFMGIGLQNVPAGRDPSLPPDQRAIKVTRVMVATGAEAAGLKTNDLIIELNGEVLRADQGQADFIAAIKDRPPGEVIFLTIVRDGEYLYKDVVLGLRPKSAIDPRDENEHREMLNQATREFAEWCRDAAQKAHAGNDK